MNFDEVSTWQGKFLADFINSTVCWKYKLISLINLNITQEEKKRPRSQTGDGREKSQMERKKHMFRLNGMDEANELSWVLSLTRTSLAYTDNGSEYSISI